MGRFNQAVAAKPDSVNLAGGHAYSESPELELASIMLTSFATDQFYRSGDDTLSRLRALIQQVDPMFSAKAALYARNEYGMRSISHVAAATLAEVVRGKPWAKRFYDRIVRRVDDMAEIMSLLLPKRGEKKRLPNAVKGGFARAFDRFDGHQLAKYRLEDKGVSLVDIVNLVHPKPTSRNKDALASLVKGELRSTDTWESELSAAGDSAAWRA